MSNYRSQNSMNRNDFFYYIPCDPLKKIEDYFSLYLKSNIELNLIFS